MIEELIYRKIINCTKGTHIKKGQYWNQINNKQENKARKNNKLQLVDKMNTNLHT